MSDPLQISQEELKKIFEIENLADKYIDYAPLKDKKAGFSVLRKYPENIRYKSPVKKNGDPDSFALIHVFVAREGIDPNKIPIILSVTIYNRYLSNHFDYYFTDKNCPTRESIELSKQSPKPVYLGSIDEYTYNYTEKNLKDKNNNTISGERILDRIFEEHCNADHLIKGFKIQWQMGSESFDIKVTEVLMRFSIRSLKLITGRSIEASRERFEGILEPYKNENIRLLSTEKINIFNYEVSKNVIITFCFLVLLWHTLAFSFGITVPYIKSIKLNNTVLFSTSVLILGILDYLLPKCIFWFINKLISFKLWLMFSRNE